MSVKLLSAIFILFVFNVSIFSQGQKNNTVNDKYDVFNNLHPINDSLYRSEQPSKKGMEYLERMEVQSVLNLRNRTNNKKEARSTKLVLLRVPINAWKMKQEDIILALKAIQSAKKPIVVHCLHGADRTGVIIASYRMVFENWSKEKAIQEFLNPQFGFHAKWFPKMVELLQNLNVNQIREELKIN